MQSTLWMMYIVVAHEPKPNQTRANTTDRRSETQRNMVISSTFYICMNVGAGGDTDIPRTARNGMDSHPSSGENYTRTNERWLENNESEQLRRFRKINEQFRTSDKTSKPQHKSTRDCNRDTS